MKLVPPDQRRAISAVRLSLALAAMVTVPLLLYAAPAWWSQHNVLTQNAASDDYAPANHGQLKNIAKAAVAEMDAKLPGGAGTELRSLIAGWSLPTAQTNDFATVNLGQLKTIAKPFYDRLIAAGLATQYPWTNAPNQPDDFAIANVGQVKNLFSFDLPAVDPLYDGDHNGLPDLWEQQYFGRTGIDPNADFDGDGISNLQEYRNHSDPTDFFNGTLSKLAVRGGGDQRGNPGTLLPVPISVMVTATYSGVVWNAPVTVMIEQGAARLVPDSSGTSAPSTQLTLRTNSYDNEGYAVAQFYVLLPPTPDLSIIRASAQGGTRSLSVFTTAVAIDTSLAAPTNLSVTATSPSTAKLTWTASMDSLPTTIQASIDDGKTWITLGTVGPGLSQATVTGLTPNQTTKFRIFSGGTPPDSNTNSFAMPDPSIGPPPPPILPGPTGGGAGDPADVVPLALPVVEVDQAEFDYGIGAGYLGMRNSGTRYKHKEIVVTTYIPKTDDSEGYTGNTTQIFNVIPGNESYGRGDREVTSTSVTGAYGGVLYIPYQTVISTDSVLRLESTDLQPQGSTASKTVTLSNPFTDADAEAAGAAANLQFYGEFYELRGNDFAAYFAHGHGNYYITIAKYRFRVNADPNLVVLWDVQFTPDSGGPVLHDIHSWHSDGSTYSPEYLLDPRLLNDGQNGNYRIVPIPAELMVDGNRDNALSFTDGAVHDADRTSEEKPYRFWVNDDQDAVSGTNQSEEVTPPQLRDNQDEKIQSLRDCEDLARLWLNIGGLINGFKTGEFQLVLRFRNVKSGNPAIRVFRSVEHGGRGYLTDEGWATLQSTPPYDQALVGTNGPGIASSTSGIYIDRRFWGGLDESDPVINLLFEGVEEGLGELYFDIIKDGQRIGVSPGVWLDIKGVEKMYERAKITLDAPNIPAPWNSRQPPLLQWAWDSSNGVSVDSNATAQTIVYVHGWRMTYNEYLSWANTTFKRLFQVGYKGRFFSFHWPTFNGENNGPDPVDLFVPGGATYNPSEYRAWLSGPALANFVNSLPNPNARYLLAHSMGNVVAGAALRSGMIVTRYAMCNSAMAAMAYDGTLTPDDPEYQTPDTDPDVGTRQTFGLANRFNPAVTEIVNFTLPNDYALSQWSENNKLFKPQVFPDGTHYFYSSQGTVGHKLGYVPLTDNIQYVISQPEAMAYVTKSRTRAAGARQDTGGAVVSFVNMGLGGFEFGDEHSAEWVYTTHKTYLFWKEVLKKFDLDVSDR